METIRLVKEPENFRAALYDGAKEIGKCTYVVTRPGAVSYTHLTLPTMVYQCRSRWSPYH